MARENATIMVTFAVILGITAVALSFVAYTKRIKIEDVSISLDGSCEYPSSPAFAVGMVAAICLVMMQITISVGTGCYCCRGNSCPRNCAGITSLILFILSWVTFVLAFLTLLGSAILNNGAYLTTSQKTVHNVDFCYLSNDNVFIGAAIWTIIFVILGLISFILSVKSSAKGNGHRPRGGGGNFANEEGVAMAEPMTPARGPSQY